MPNDNQNSLNPRCVCENMARLRISVSLAMRMMESMPWCFIWAACSMVRVSASSWSDGEIMSGDCRAVLKCTCLSLVWRLSYLLGSPSGWLHMLSTDLIQFYFIYFIGRTENSLASLYKAALLFSPLGIWCPLMLLWGFSPGIHHTPNLLFYTSGDELLHRWWW